MKRTVQMKRGNGGGVGGGRGGCYSRPAKLHRAVRDALKAAGVDSEWIDYHWQTFNPGSRQELIHDANAILESNGSPERVR